MHQVGGGLVGDEFRIWMQSIVSFMIMDSDTQTAFDLV